MKISPKTRNDIRAISIFVFLGTLAGVLISSIITGGVSAATIFIGGGVGFSISFLCAFGNFSVLPRFRHLPFTPYLLIKSLYFTAVTLAVRGIRFLLFSDVMGYVPDKGKIFVLATLVTLAISLVANLLFMFRRIIGQKTLFNLLTGRYHKPLEEERIFMFLDIASSMAIAERIGHKNFHVFLDNFFNDITDPILLAGGEIYKYVGDEVIVN